MAPTPTPRHRVFDHKILALFVVLAIYVVLANILSLVGMLFSYDTQYIANIAAFGAPILMLLWYSFHFRHEFKGILNWSNQGMLLVAPALIFAGLNLMDWPEATFVNPFLLTFMLAMVPGVSEEIIFRGIPGSNWMRVDGEAKDILPNVLFTSAIFGLVHGLNALVGADIAQTIFQIFYAMCLGVLFEAVILRSGSLWPSMILHTLIDFTGFLFMDMSQGGVITSELEFGLGFYLTLAASVCLLLCGLYFIRPAKHAEIVALWKDKWHKA